MEWVLAREQISPTTALSRKLLRRANESKGLTLCSEISVDNNRIAWLQKNVLLHILALDDVVVVELESPRRPFSTRRTTILSLSAYSRRPPTTVNACNTFMSVFRTGSGERPVPNLAPFCCCISLNHDRRIGLGDEFRRGLFQRFIQLLGRKTRRLDVVQERNRDLSVGSNDDVGGELGIGPETDGKEGRRRR